MKYDISDLENIFDSMEHFLTPLDEVGLKQHFQTKIEEAEKRGYVKGVSDHSKRVEGLISQAKKEALEEALEEIDTEKEDVERMGDDYSFGYLQKQEEDKQIIQSLIKNMNKIPDGEPFNKNKFVERLTEVQTEINKIEEPDLSDLKSKFRKVETQINGTNYYMISVDVYNNLEQYLQTKIDQEVKKVQHDNEILVNTILETKKEEVKKVVEEIKEEVLSAKYGTKNRVELLCKLNSYLK